MGATTDPIKAAQVLALADMGYPASQAGAAAGVPRRTARDIIAGVGHWGRIDAEAPVYAQFRHEQNRALEATARQLAAKLWIHAEDNLEKMQPYQAVVAGSILVDKAQVLAGLPTEITASVNLQVEARADQLIEALSSALLLKSQATPPAIDVTPPKNE